MKELQLQQKIKTVVTEEVLNKIKYLCSKINKVEWSGILLYSTEGTIREPETMVLTLQDIIPMNKGSQAYTDYKFNEPKRDNTGFEDRHIDYMSQNEKAYEWSIGLIHSHNTMSVFFSGTDQEELLTNAASHNIYLSFIVNNFMEFTGKVAYMVTPEPSQVLYTALDENGVKYEIKKEETIGQSVVMTHNCDIVVPAENLILDDFFIESVESIITKAEEKAKEKTYSFGNSWNRGAKSFEDFETKYNTPYNKNSNQIKMDFSKSYNSPLSIYSKSELKEDRIYEKESEMIEKLLIDFFSVDIFREKEREYKYLEDYVEEFISKADHKKLLDFMTKLKVYFVTEYKGIEVFNAFTFTDSIVYSIVKTYMLDIIEDFEETAFVKKFIKLLDE